MTDALTTTQLVSRLFADLLRHCETHLTNHRWDNIDRETLIRVREALNALIQKYYHVPFSEDIVNIELFLKDSLLFFTKVNSSEFGNALSSFEEEIYVLTRVLEDSAAHRFEEKFANGQRHINAEDYINDNHVEMHLEMLTPTTVIQLAE